MAVTDAEPSHDVESPRARRRSLRERLGRSAGRVGGLTDISLASRLSLVALLVTLVSLVVTATVGLVRGADLADDISEDRLVAVAAARADSVAIYLRTVERQVTALAASPAAAASIDALGAAYADLDGESVEGARTERVTEHYLVDVVPQLQATRGGSIGASFLLPESTAAIYLQSEYVVPDVDDDDEGRIDRELVVDAGDGSEYSSVHRDVHQTYGAIGALSEFDDVFLIGTEDDIILYSLRKRVDFATSLDLGPYSGSSLARLVDEVESDPSTVVGDLSGYGPAGDRPVLFVVSPVTDGDGSVVGAVAASLPVDTFDAIVSGGGAWANLGDSGEAYLVGADGLLRSTTRAFEESPLDYLSQETDDGAPRLSASDRRRISATETTALVEWIDRSVLADALDGPGFDEVVNYRGQTVQSAYRPVPNPGVSWAVFAEVTPVERDQGIRDYARDMLLAIAIFVVVVTFIAVRWANRLMEPIRAIAARLRAVRHGRAADPDEHRVGDVALHADPTGDRADAIEIETPGRPDEYEQLLRSVDQMLARLDRRQLAVEARNEERATLLREFLPAAVAARTEQNDGDVLDHVANASVVVLVPDGLGELIVGRAEQDLRDLLADVIDEIDALAADHGLERIKLAGVDYYAVCGANRPYLDHAPRSVAFGLGACELVEELSDGAISLRVGVATGPVSVGLTARSALMYDAWGATVTQAEELAQGSPRNAATVSRAVHSQLPEDFVTVGDVDPDADAVVVTARVDGRRSMSGSDA